MPVSFSPELERRIAEKIESGEYDSAEDVVTDALDALSDRTEEEEAKLRSLRADIDIGIAEMERGEGIPGALAAKQAKAEFRRLTGRAP
ncbi:ribbon-helix-helix domain-containing protein [Longimicrobium sp.]|uniref:ribbon-helix-helix domain-containing protein n=1 Tax=Longimicrobium sp. TaxID=2029185 RepID=UPI003B3AC9E0